MSKQSEVYEDIQAKWSEIVQYLAVISTSDVLFTCIVVHVVAIFKMLY